MTDDYKKLCEDLRDYPKGKPFTYRWEELQIEAAEAIERLSGDIAVERECLKRAQAADGFMVEELATLKTEIKRLSGELAGMKHVATSWHEKWLANSRELAALKAQGEPYCTVYEYDSVFGLHRSLKNDEWNGSYPNRAIPLYLHPPEDAKDAALENCRLLAARHRKEEWAQHILRFCESAGITGSPLRDAAIDKAMEAK